jgi:hypothetical protein
MPLLLMELPDKLFDLRDAALEDEIAVVGLAFGDLTSDGGQHQIFHFPKIRRLAQSPGQLDVGTSYSMFWADMIPLAVRSRPVSQTNMCTNHEPTKFTFS